MKNRVCVCVWVSLLALLSAVGVRAQQRSVRDDGLQGQSSVAAEPQTPSRAAQTPGELVPPLVVPRLVKFGGTLKDTQGKLLSNTVGVTFAIYKGQEGGAPLWVETQNVTPDEQGNYSVLLGATKSEGLSLELFSSGEPRWLGVQVQLPGEVEQPRVLLVSVPYALKAADAETLGGQPLSSFVLNAAQATSGSGTSATSQTTAEAVTTPTPGSGAKKAVSGTGSTNFVTKWLDTAGTLGNSLIFDNGTNVGIGTTSPAVALDVMGNNAGLRLSGTGTHEVLVTGVTNGRLGQDGNGFFFANDTTGSNVRFLTNNGTLNEWMRITSAGNVGIDTSTPAATLDVNGNLNLPTTTSASVGVLTLGGVRFLHNFGTYNTFVGTNAGNTTMTAGHISAFGYNALANNTSGDANSAFGHNALAANNTGSDNSAFGGGALVSNTTGGSDSGFGHHALYSNSTGSTNSAFGESALANDASGSSNSAFGSGALSSLTTGNNNIAIGSSAGSSLNGSESNNIYIGNAGMAGESGIIRIGTQGTHLATLIAGIQGTLVSGTAVYVNSNGQLGIATSSRRFKHQIADMGAESDILMKLRPVAFYYKPELDETQTRQYGLVAEEVAQVAPNLVVFDENGQPQTVRYHFVNAMLLNEVQRQHAQIEALKQENTELRQQLQSLLLQVKQIRDQVEATSAKQSDAAETSLTRAGASTAAAGQR